MELERVGPTLADPSARCGRCGQRLIAEKDLWMFETARQLYSEVWTTRSGRFKVYWGRDTANAVGIGGNRKYEPACGQPRRGFATYAEADAFQKALPLRPFHRLGNGHNIPERLFPKEAAVLPTPVEGSGA